MSEPVAEDLRYPVGKPLRAESFTAQQRDASIEVIRLLPRNLASAVHGFSDAQLDTPYRPEGWTVRQVVHHVADSHMNAYLRVRLALTEDEPAIIAYQEKSWAELPDARTADVATSLHLLEGLHQRWVQLWKSLDEEQWKRAYIHPVNGRQSLEQAVILYDWHSRHHTAHVTQLAARSGW